ncbi:MAG: hypothetical protein WBB81_00255 [Pyrinomonadaceae bacterium]
MPSSKGNLRRFDFDSSRPDWLVLPILVFEPLDNCSLPVGEPKWFNFDFTYSEESRSLRKKISLFGSFNDEFAFSLNGAKPSNKKLKDRLKHLGKFCDGQNVKLSVSCHADRTYAEAISHDNLLLRTYPRVWLYTFHTFWIGNFIDRNKWHLINRLAEFYSGTDCDLSGDIWIDVTSFEDLLSDDGNHLGVFRNRLIRPRTDSSGAIRPNWLSTRTYKYAPETNCHPDAGIFIRLSRTGILEVREVVELDDQNNTLFEFLKLLLRIGDQPVKKVEDIHRCVRDFVRELLEQFKSGGVRIIDAWDPSNEDDVPRIQRVRQRYTVVMMSRLTNEQNGRESVRPSILWEHPRIIRGLLEGTMVVAENNKKAYGPPDLSKRAQKSLKNESTWEDEICVFGADRCLIFFNPKIILEKDGRFVNYSDYWRTITRGIEHTVSVRTTLHLYESWTRNRMEDIPRLLRLLNLYEKVAKAETTASGIDKYSEDETRLLADFNLSEVATPEITTKIEETLQVEMDKIAETVAGVLRNLPAIREVSVGASSFLSEHAVNKFNHLNEKVFRFPELVRHIQQNIDEMTSFLVYFKQREFSLELERARTSREEAEATRQARETRQTTYLAVLGLLLAILAAFYTGPLFLDAFHAACKEQHSIWQCLASDHIHVYGIIYLSASIAAYLLGTGLFYFFLWNDVKVALAGKERWARFSKGVVIVVGFVLLIALLGWIFLPYLSFLNALPQLPESPSPIAGGH